MLGLLLTMGVAQADVFYAEDGFVISSDVGNITRTAQIGSTEGNFFQVIGGGDSNVTISNANGLFDFNYILTMGHYPQDDTIISVYGQNGLIDTFVTGMRHWLEDGTWVPSYYYSYGGGSYTDVSYIYLESVYPLGIYSFGLPENISAVPEPSQWALLLLGVAAMLGLSRRRGGMTMALPA